MNVGLEMGNCAPLIEQSYVVIVKKITRILQYQLLKIKQFFPFLEIDEKGYWVGSIRWTGCCDAFQLR